MAREAAVGSADVVDVWAVWIGDILKDSGDWGRVRTNKVEGGEGRERRVGEDAKRRVGHERCQDDLQAALVYTPLNRDGIDQTPPGSGRGAGLLGREDGRARGLGRRGTRNQEPACLCRPPAVRTAVGTGKQSHSCRLQFQRLSLERAPGTGSVPMASRFRVQTRWGCEVRDGGLLCGRQAGTSTQASADGDAHFLGDTRQ